jgi:hypothetical protein
MTERPDGHRVVRIIDGAPRTWVDRLPLMVLAALAAGFLTLGVAEPQADAPTFDEPVYVSADLAAVLHHDVTLNDEHPPLPKVLAVLPVLFAHPVVPANGRLSGNDELRYGARFVAAPACGREAAQRHARLPTGPAGRTPAARTRRRRPPRRRRRREDPAERGPTLPERRSTGA